MPYLSYLDVCSICGPQFILIFCVCVRLLDGGKVKTKTATTFRLFVLLIFFILNEIEDL